MVVKKETAKLRASHNWVARFEKKFLNRIGIGKTELSFMCEGNSHTIELKGSHVCKGNFGDDETRARLMRRRGNNFYFLSDLSEVGVNKFSRKRGGYFLYIITEVNGEFIVKRKRYSKRRVKHLNLEGLTFYNVFWRIFNDCYYGVTVEENGGGDNSS